jgi:3-hydroxyisobutyrate dehydrogenase
METVGFIGLGHMGSALAQRMLMADYPLVVFDINQPATQSFRETGAHVAANPAEVARLSDVVFSSLPGPREVEQVSLGAGGIVEGIREGSVYVDFSTARPSFIRQLAVRFAEHGAYVLDAPLSGGRAKALEGHQEVMVGGDQQVFERIRPILATFADQILYIGEVGAGTICKLVHNMVQRGMALVIAEGMTLGAKAGVDAQTVWESVRRGLAGRQSTLHETMPQSVFTGNYDDATYTLALAYKDIALATELARELAVPLPLCTLAEQTAMQGMNRGWPEKSPAVLFQLQEEAANVDLRVPDFDAATVDRFQYGFVASDLARQKARE